MAQDLVVYALVAAAAVWVAWRLLLPARIKRSLRARLGRRAEAKPCERCGD